MKIIDKNSSKIVCGYNSGDVIPNVQSVKANCFDEHLLLFEFGLQVLSSDANEPNFNIACFSCCIGICSIGLGYINTQYTVTLMPVNDTTGEKIIHTHKKHIECYNKDNINNEYVSFSFNTKRYTSRKLLQS